MDKGPTYARLLWGEMAPLPEVWAHDYRPGSRNFGGRDRVLAYWLRMAESDPWTFDQVGDLLGAMLDSGEDVPPCLDTWAREVASRRRSRPRPKGRRRTDRADDSHVALQVRALAMMTGSRREACRIVGGWLAMSPENVESAWRRWNATV